MTRRPICAAVVKSMIQLKSIGGLENKLSELKSAIRLKLSNLCPVLVETLRKRQLSEGSKTQSPAKHLHLIPAAVPSEELEPTQSQSPQTQPTGHDQVRCDTLSGSSPAVQV